MKLRSPVLQGLLEGEFPLSGTPCICDVRDLARAHILAAELPLQQLDSRYAFHAGQSATQSISATPV